MAVDWESIAAEVGEAIASVGSTDEGFQATLLRSVAFDGGRPWDPSDTPPDVTEHACTIVVTEYSQREIDGTLIMSGDKKVLISTSGLQVSPEPGDEFRIQGERFSVINVQPLSPAGTVVLWEAQARRIGRVQG